MSVKIEISKEAIARFCRRNHIRRLALFGSVLRDDFTPESDVDVLVEFEPGQIVGFAFFAMQDELSELLGRKVDMNTRAELSPYFRAEVLAEAQVLYESA
jgi:predicted nucleotidyltransferase